MDKALYFGVHDTNYPRNRRIRKYLQGLGFEIEILPAPKTSSMAKGYLLLVWRIFRDLGSYRDCRTIILAEFSVQYAPLCYLLAKATGAGFVMDFFIGLEESEIDDRGVSKGKSWRRALYRLLDTLALKLSDLCVTDTDVRGRAQQHRYLLSVQPLTLPVGAPSWASTVEEKSTVREHALKVLYYGNYVPLHGVDVLLSALAEARETLDVRLTLVGEGKLRPGYQEFARDLGLSGVCTFLDAIPEDDLPRIISEHDVVVGVFGDSPKAESVIANKVWQGLASSRHVVTRRSRALVEIEGIVGAALRQVEPNSSAIAAEFALVAEDSNGLPTALSLELEQYVARRFETFGHQVRSLAAVRRAT